MKNWYTGMILVALLLGGCMTKVISQEISYTASKNEVLSSLINWNKLVGHDADNFYGIHSSGTQYFIQKMDKELNLLLEEPMKMYKGLKTFTFETVVHFHNEIYLFVSYRRFDEIILYYQKLNKSDLLPATDLIEVATIEFIKGNWADFHFSLSRQETKLLITCRTKLNWSHVQFNEYYVYGENFELIWKKKDSFEFQGQGPRNNKYLVDDDGNVAILSLLKRESILSLLQDVKNAYTIYRYTQNGNEFMEYPITLPDRYIRGLKIVGGEDGALICAGLYSDILRSGIKGTFFFKIDAATGKIFDRTLNKFDDAVLTELSGIKEPMINSEEVINYVMTDMVLRKNGKMIMVAEQVFNQTYNNYNNLIVTCYDLQGQVYWTRVIAKRQNFNISAMNLAQIDLPNYRDHIKETGIMIQNVNNQCSYALMAPLDKTGIILFYNDDNRNSGSSGLNKVVGNPKKSYIKAVTIDEFGNLAEKELINWKKKALFPEPIRFYDTRYDTIVIPAIRSRHINYYKITAQISP